MATFGVTTLWHGVVLTTLAVVGCVHYNVMQGGMAVGVVTESFDVETGILGAHEGSWAYSVSLFQHTPPLLLPSQDTLCSPRQLLHLQGRTGDKGDGKLQSYEAYGDSFKTGDEVRIELDMDLGTLQFSLNGYPQVKTTQHLQPPDTHTQPRT